MIASRFTFPSTDSMATSNGQSNAASGSSRTWTSKDWLEIEEVLDGESLKKPGRGRRLIAVHGDEFDSHDGQLKITGADDHLRRYVQAIRKLRDAGYSRVIVLSDHGFFHWQPDDHEIEDDLPTGKVLWKHRRAMVGHDLSHPSAVHMEIPQSDLEVVVPRSTSAFRTYGALGFFHGGATLQEMIIPVVVASWPAKARKVNVVLKPVGHITSEAPRVQVQAASTGQLFNADVNLLARRVLVKVKDPASRQARVPAQRSDHHRAGRPCRSRFSWQSSNRSRNWRMERHSWSKCSTPTTRRFWCART